MWAVACTGTPLASLVFLVPRGTGKQVLNPTRFIVCREAVTAKLLHAIIKMVESSYVARWPTEVVLQDRASNHLKVL